MRTFNNSGSFLAHSIKTDLAIHLRHRILTLLSGSNNNNTAVQPTSPVALPDSPSASSDASIQQRRIENDNNGPATIFGANGDLTKRDAWYVMCEIVAEDINLSRTDCFGSDLSKNKKGRIVMVIRNLQRVLLDEEQKFMRSKNVPTGKGKEVFEERKKFLANTANIAKQAVNRIITERLPFWNTKSPQTQRTLETQGRELGSIASLLEKTETAFKARNNKKVGDFFPQKQSKKQRTSSK